MQITVNTHNLDATEAVKNYAEEKLGIVAKYLPENENADLVITLGKTSEHHTHGNVFEAKARIKSGNTEVYVSSVKDDMYAAIDELKDKALENFAQKSDKNKSLLRKFARKVKAIFRGN